MARCFYVAVVASAVGLACAGSPRPVDAELGELLTNPNGWVDATVAVTGFIAYDLHGTMLFVTERDCNYFNHANGIGVFLHDVPEAEDRIIHNRCTMAVVTGLYSPELEDWPPRGPHEDGDVNFRIVVNAKPGYLFASEVDL